MSDQVDELLREIETLRNALKGRTVSCGQCNTLAREIEDLKHQMKQRDCIACNSFLTGNGWCDRHKAMLANVKP